MPRKTTRPYCTASVVGMLTERGWSIERIAQRVRQPEKVVRLYLRVWKQATPQERALARSGTVLPPD